MSVVELHPEELIDRAARGKLTDVERAHLDAHLEGCVACRFELEARCDFAEELAGDDAPLARDSGQIAAILGRALTAANDEATPTDETPITETAATASAASTVADAGPATAPPSEAPSDAPDAAEKTGEVIELPRARPSRRRRLTVALVACAAVVFAASAAALTGSRLFTPEREASPPDPPPPAIDLGTPAAPTRRTAPLPKDDAPPAASTDEAPAPPASTEAAPPVEAPRPAQAASAKKAEPKPAGELFAAANEARRRGDLDRAAALYRELERTHPDSDEAKTARATLARLLLERGDAGAALDGFDAYLDKSKGTLTEDAMVGRAEALFRMGKTGEEADAWRALLQRFPNSAHAARAKARLAALAP